VTGKFICGVEILWKWHVYQCDGVWSKFIPYIVIFRKLLLCDIARL